MVYWKSVIVFGFRFVKTVHVWSLTGSSNYGVAVGMQISRGQGVASQVSFGKKGYKNFKVLLKWTTWSMCFILYYFLFTMGLFIFIQIYLFSDLNDSLRTQSPGGNYRVWKLRPCPRQKTDQRRLPCDHWDSSSTQFVGSGLLPLQCHCDVTAGLRETSPHCVFSHTFWKLQRLPVQSRRPFHRQSCRRYL